jgi:MFS family permease
MSSPCILLCLCIISPAIFFQPLFFPKEAESKGATASDYGFVFGLYELVVFISSPILGKNMKRLGAKRVFNAGILVIGSCYIIFGLLVSGF